MVYKRDFLFNQTGGFDNPRPEPPFNRYRPPPPTAEEVQIAENQQAQAFLNQNLSRIISLFNEEETPEQEAEIREIIQAITNRFGADANFTVDSILDFAEEYFRENR